jgi:uncharacterized protein (DUF1800 family)
MERRELLARMVGDTDSPEKVNGNGGAQSLQEKVSPFANKSLPKVARTTAGLEPYTGPWTLSQVQHLLRRTTFGPVKSHVDTLLPMSMDSAVDLLLAPQAVESSQPLTTDARDLVAVGTTWVDQLYRSADPLVTFTPTGIRTNSLKAWWTGLIMNQSLSIREKLVLFWHNHFVTEIVNVNDPRYSYRYNALLRSYALGNFKNMVYDVTVDGAMLVYLNGNSNTKSGPDENYARELQELFTIGKGPVAGPGDYTNYTENDVKAAAHVLTGWRKFQNADGTVGPVTGYFDPARHDTASKTFSARYNNTIIPGASGATAGATELLALLDMIFAQPETAKFICRKLYRWFVYYLIDETTESTIITPMADILRQNNYVIAPALSALLKSAHFFDPVNVGCMIKNPIDFVTGVCRQFSVAPPAADVVKQYQGWLNLSNQGNLMGQDIGEPPNVAGWPAYYQIPEFSELWINSDTLPKRSKLTNAMIGNGYTTGGVTLVIDPIAFALTLPNPADANALIADAAERLLPIPLTDNQKVALKNVLLGGLPDYEWPAEWVPYTMDPTNPTKSKPIKTKLQALLGLMLRMPEFQLS